MDGLGFRFLLDGLFFQNDTFFGVHIYPCSTVALYNVAELEEGNIVLTSAFWTQDSHLSLFPYAAIRRTTVEGGILGFRPFLRNDPLNASLLPLENRQSLLDLLTTGKI